MNKKGLLLVNLGTPDSPETDDVKTYLKEFLSDSNVIQMPKLLWQPILRGKILPKRAPKSAQLYQKIWRKDGSPLMVYAQKQTEQVQQLVPDWIVRCAMTYRKPNIAETLRKMRLAGADDIVVLPLFPQYSVTSTQSVIDQVHQTDQSIKVIQSFYDDDAYLDLLARDIREAWSKHDYDTLILSYHGIPESYVRRGDPYVAHCTATTQGVLERIGPLTTNNTHQVFQSRFGPTEWVKPYLSDTLMSLPRQGNKRVLVSTPAFVADCLETIEEIHVENQEIFKQAGGEVFDVVKPFNDDIAFSKYLVSLAQRYFD
ncbi:ferrochelatase [Leuconostoc litchii]|uniref:Coproporphyrin III ferrochelatase n=1 Tax=Leuconostoc litchii TaxID=1981069 RepID=A0A6P2CN70_9LACO|nr:ferrochelatase [Leuconostoc litchii]TYC47498.1 ferrochelatase [Leuconostoc litchii]GMA69524.1 ferrochelatase [Leuconostoc litchii]